MLTPEYRRKPVQTFFSYNRIVLFPKQSESTSSLFKPCASKKFNLQNGTCHQSIIRGSIPNVRHVSSWKESPLKTSLHHINMLFLVIFWTKLISCTYTLFKNFASFLHQNKVEFIKKRRRKVP